MKTIESKVVRQGQWDEAHVVLDHDEDAGEWQVAYMDNKTQWEREFDTEKEARELYDSIN